MEPNRVSAYDGLNLYWGDLHCHVRERRRDRASSGSLGAGGPWTLDEVYAYGREDSRLDFVAVTDHDVTLSPQEWEDTMAAAARWTEPGRFVAFLGYEWSHVSGEPSSDYGHRNVIYRRTEGPMLSCGDERYHSAPKLWRALKDCSSVNDVIVIPHHPARAASGIWWNHDHWDAELERLVEVYSLWGSSEKAGPPFEIHYLEQHSPTGRGEAPGHFVQDGLAKGHRFGIVAGSESHDGRPGNPIYHGPHRCGVDVCYRGGIQGTYASSLTRGDLFAAFRGRRCFGTTGAKIRLEFTLNSVLMGGEAAAAEERQFAVAVAGTDALASVEVVRNNKEVHRESPSDSRVEFTWRDSRALGDVDYYYVRVTQRDGNMAWSSPIWVGR